MFNCFRLLILLIPVINALLRLRNTKYRYSQLNTGNTFDWDAQWYPIAVAEFTDKSKIHPVQFLNQDIALWHDGAQWNAFLDKCPHRLVPLTEGRVEGGELECSYHGWTFNRDGRVNKIPQADGDEALNRCKSNTRSCAAVFPIREEQGLLWIYGKNSQITNNVFAEAQSTPLQLVEELNDSVKKEKMNVIAYDFRDLPYGWDYFMVRIKDLKENLINCSLIC